MDPIIGSALVGAGSSLLGNVLGGMSSSSANEAAMQRQQAATYFNFLAQDKAQGFNAAEAQKARDFNAAEARHAEQFSADQAVIGREFNSAEAAKGRGFAERMQDEAQKFNLGSAREQMSFQERMRATQYQTAMADMRAAGLNPILAYSQGGAGTPTGASGHSSAASAASASSGASQGVAASSGAASSPGGSGSSAAQTFRRPVLELGNLLSSALALAQIKNVEAQTQKTEAETRNVEAEQIGPHGKPTTYSTLERANRSEYLATETALVLEKQDLTQAETELVRQQVKNAVKEGHRIEATTGNLKADTVLKTLQQAEARAASRYHTENPNAYGYMYGLKMFGEGASGAGSLLRMFR